MAEDLLQDDTEFNNAAAQAAAASNPAGVPQGGGAYFRDPNTGEWVRNTPENRQVTRNKPPKPAGNGYGFGYKWNDQLYQWVPIHPSEVPGPHNRNPSAGETATFPSPPEMQVLNATTAGLDIGANPMITGTADTAAGIRGSATAGVDAAGRAAMKPGVAGQVADPRNISVGRAPSPVTASTSASSSSIDRANTAAGKFGGVQEQQQGYIEQLQAQAAGKGPSVAGDMMRAAGAEDAFQTEKAVADAVAQYGENSIQARDAYAQASDKAAADYANAYGDQQAAIEYAAMNADQQTRRAAEDAVRSQAALTSAARGPMIGAALLNAQSNAAGTMQRADQQIFEQREQRQQAAGAQAAAAGRTTAANAAQAGTTAARIQAGADAATMNAQVQADLTSKMIKAKADIEAGRVLSEEQMNALAQLGIGIKDLQGMTNDEVMAAVNVGNLGLGVDQLVTGTLAGNADRELAARGQDIGVEQFDIGQETGVATGNADRDVNMYGINNAAALQVMNTQAGREAMALAAEGDMAALAAELNMTEAELGVKLFTAAKDLGLEYDKMDRQDRRDLIAGIMTGGTGFAAQMFTKKG